MLALFYIPKPLKYAFLGKIYIVLYISIQVILSIDCINSEQISIIIKVQFLH